MGTNSNKDCLGGLEIAVITTADGVGGSIANEMTRRGARVTTLGERSRQWTGTHVQSDFRSREEARRAMGALIQHSGALDCLIQAATLPDNGVLTEIEDMTVEDWISIAELPVKRTFWALQAAHPHLSARQGRIVLVISTICVTGMAGATAIGAALEGQRLLGKVVARQWGKDGISVNFLLLSPETLSPSIGDIAVVKRMAEVGTGWVAPALHAVGTFDVDRDLAPLVAFLASRDGGVITGQTIVADGGSWMVP